MKIKHYKVLYHAIERMHKREITTDMVLKALEKGNHTRVNSDKYGVQNIVRYQNLRIVISKTIIVTIMWAKGSPEYNRYENNNK